MKISIHPHRCIWLTRLVTAALFCALIACSPTASVPIDPGMNPPITTQSPDEEVPPTFTPTLEKPVKPTSTNEPTPEPTEEPATETPIPPPAPIILVSFDGAPDQLVSEWMQNGVLPTFASLAKQGLHAEAMRTIDPALTASAHASMVTGYYPSETGIVGNLYHNPADSIYWYRSGFSQALDQVEPVWVNASRAGYTTAALFIAGGTPFLPGQTADYTIAYGTRLAYSNLESLKLEPVTEEWEGEVPISYSPPFEGSWIIPKVTQVYVYAYDSQDDGVTAYDDLLVNTARVADDAAAHLSAGEWSPLELDPTKRAGAHFLLQSISYQGGRVSITLFQSSVNHNLATPRILLEALNESFGFFPAPADSYALEHDWITPEQFLEMIDRSTRWMEEVTAWVYNTYHPDLTFTWLDTFDVAGHAFYPGQPGMPGYDAPSAGSQADLYAKAAGIADQALDHLTSVVPLDEATYILVSDHGMAPVHTTVNLNTLIEKAGWLVLDNKDYVVVDRTQAIAFASGGSANIYINLAGRDKDGIVTETSYLTLREEIVDALSSLRHPDTGEPVFSRILVKEELAELHLDHIHSGDIFAQAFPGFNLDSHRGYRGIFQDTRFNGQHGYDSTLKEMEAIFIAAGAGITPAGVTAPPVHITDIVPTLSGLLNLPISGDLPGIGITGIVPSR